MISAGFAHAADLPVKSLGQYNGKCLFPHFVKPAGPGSHIQFLQIYALCHLIHELRCHCMIHGDNILLFMSIAAAHDFIHQIPLICHKKQTLRLLIQPSHRIDPFRILQVFHYIFSPVLG